ncbi:hypothetical protein PR003_g26358 [Phytophthora rubi]|uniref:Uncharacterized protein n=1 Tax=Phytophthora rubi TaxID=129364 RepID=A0A6A3I6M1_9STRA|nr:hypothetical protein PR002_g25468 [Phytophthora rubi]KAE9286286.1 hypothetical protein PR003_g26358 [Phytophthora rubi]
MGKPLVCTKGMKDVIALASSAMSAHEQREKSSLPPDGRR